MFKSKKGFTLIELLIVVAIIGILAALLIPNAITAMQKAKQKATMKDIMTIATALVDHVTDNGMIPLHGGLLTGPTDPFLINISPFYVKVCPWADKWGYGYIIDTQTNVGSNFVEVATGDPIGPDDFVVGSTGRDGAITGPGYSSGAPEDGFYTVKSMLDFDRDLAIWNGNWVVGPKTYTEVT